MRISTAALAGASLFALVACQPGAAPLAEADRIAIRAADSAFAAAATAGDVEAIVASYTPDAIVLPPNMGISAGPVAIRELFTTMLAAGRIRLTLTTGTIEGAGDIAYVTGSYEMMVVLPDSTQPAPPAEVGKYFAVFRRLEDGSWRMARDMWGSIAMPTPAEAAAPTTRR